MESDTKESKRSERERSHPDTLTFLTTPADSVYVGLVVLWHHLLLHYQHHHPHSCRLVLAPEGKSAETTILSFFLGRRLSSVHAGEPKSFRGPSGYLIPRAAAILSTPDAPIITSPSGEYPGVIYWCLNYHLTYKNLNSILRSKNRGSSSASESLIVNTCF